MAANVFPYHNGTHFNIEGDSGESGSGGGTYTISLTAAPQKIQIGAAVTFSFEVRRNNQPVNGAVISIANNAQSVGATPSIAYTGVDGKAVFSAIGSAFGTFTISGSTTIDGTPINSSSVTITVQDAESPEIYDATGYGQIKLTIESSLANALQTKVQRLSHQEQIRKYPNDTGLRRLSFYETAEIIFIIKDLLK